MRRAAAALATIAMTAAALPASSGPYRLTAAHSPERLQSGGLDVLAPDASAIASHRLYVGLTIVDLRADRAVTVAGDLGVGLFGGTRTDKPPMAWSANGRFLWAAFRDIQRPLGGWSLSGLRPVRVARNGAMTPLPALRSPAGPLDALMWIGHDGLALAQFGTSGGYYKPEHDDPAPELAIVDAAHGRVLDRLPLGDLPSYRARPHKQLGARATIGWASAVRLPDGRVRVLVKVAGALVCWTQGERAVELPNPAPGDQFTQGALLPSGKAFLLTRALQPDGPNIQYRFNDPRRPPAPPPRPRTGPLLELRDYGTGRLIWTVTQTAHRFWTGDVLTVDDRGEYALASAPPADHGKRLTLVRLRDGAIVHDFPRASDNAGFAGTAVWFRAAKIEIHRRR